MIDVSLPHNAWTPRHHQMPLWRYLREGASERWPWHRRWQRRRVSHHTAISVRAPGKLFWHMLPEYAQARKAIWDAVNPHTGIRRIDEAFPAELRASTAIDMHIRLSMFDLELHWQRRVRPEPLAHPQPVWCLVSTR
jgi:hypothetical protein